MQIRCKLLTRFWNSMKKSNWEMVMSGSIIDGSCHNSHFTPGVLPDIDLMAVLYKLKQEEQTKYLRYIEDSPGFVSIDVTDAPEQSWLKLPGNLVQKGNKCFLSRSRFSDHCEMAVKDAFRNMNFGPSLGYTAAANSAAIAVKLKDAINDSDHQQEYEENTQSLFEDLIEEEPGLYNSVYKDAVEVWYQDLKMDIAENVKSSWPQDLSPKETHIGKVDHVHVLSCEEWPAICKSWGTRERVWPTRDIILEVINGGFHLVPKASLGGDQDVEWRASFSAAENIIMTKLTNIQHTAFCIFKESIKFNILLDQVITTYHLKSVFFWALEKMPLEIWKETRICECVTGLLQTLLHMVGSNELPHYFIPEINLLAKIPLDALSTYGSQLVALFDKLSILQINPDDYGSWDDSVALQFAVIYLANSKRASQLSREYVTKSKSSSPTQDVDFLFTSSAADISEMICETALLICKANEMEKVSDTNMTLITKILSFGHYACENILKNKLHARNLGPGTEIMEEKTEANERECLLHFIAGIHAVMEITDIINHVIAFVHELLENNFDQNSCSRMERGIKKLTTKYNIKSFDTLTICQLANKHFLNKLVSWLPKHLEYAEDVKEGEDSCWDKQLDDAIEYLFLNPDPECLLTVIVAPMSRSFYMQGEGLSFLPLVEFLFPDNYSNLIPYTQMAEVNV